MDYTILLQDILEELRLIRTALGPKQEQQDVEWESPSGRRLVRVQGAQHAGKCLHWYGRWYCPTKATTTAGYCSRHDPEERRLRAEARIGRLCQATKKDGTPCRELASRTGYCRHHLGK